jgi:hypothetical protein
VVDLQRVWHDEAEFLRFEKEIKPKKTRQRRTAMDFSGSLLTTAGTVAFKRGVLTGIFIFLPD